MVDVVNKQPVIKILISKLLKTIVLSRGVMSIQSAPSDFWAKWILKVASKRQKNAE